MFLSVSDELYNHSPACTADIQVISSVNSIPVAKQLTYPLPGTVLWPHSLYSAQDSLQMW